MYDFHTVSVVVNPAGNNQRAFGGNANRVALIITSSDPANALRGFFLLTKNNFATAYYGAATPTNDKLPYRDYGPLIQQEVWVSGGNSTLNGTLTEVVRIPGTK